jgi:hypothetical protein
MNDNNEELTREEKDWIAYGAAVGVTICQTVGSDMADAFIAMDTGILFKDARKRLARAKEAVEKKLAEKREKTETGDFVFVADKAIKEVKNEE